MVSGAVNGNSKHKPAWRCTGTVKTGQTSIKTAHCSSAKKTALGKLDTVPPRHLIQLLYVQSYPFQKEMNSQYGTSKSQNLHSAWSIKVSSGRQFVWIDSSANQLCSEPICDLDWISTPNMQSILAVGFDHHIDYYVSRE